MTQFCVHARTDAIARPHRVEADGFVEAALTYAERWLPHDAEEPLVLYVEDEDSGEERCLTLDLGGGVRPCG